MRGLAEIEADENSLDGDHLASIPGRNAPRLSGLGRHLLWGVRPGPGGGNGDSAAWGWPGRAASGFRNEPRPDGGCPREKPDRRGQETPGRRSPAGDLCWVMMRDAIGPDSQA